MLENNKRPFERFIGSRWFPLTIAGVALLSIMVITFFLGFRITYAPILDNNWEAVSGVAAWVGIFVSIVSAIASFMAVWFAVRVADKQNNIALFEKKYELFILVDTFDDFARLLTMIKTGEDILLAFLLIFYNIREIEKVKDRAFIRTSYIASINQLGQTEFLFKNKQIYIYISFCVKCLGELINVSLENPKENVSSEKLRQFIETVDNENYRTVVNEMRQELNLI